MRTLVVTRLSPFPPNAGVPLRVAANLSGLAKLGPVDVIIIGDEPTGAVPDYISSVETFPVPDTDGVVGGLARKFGLRHPLAAELFRPEVEAAIGRLGAGPGLIVLDEVWMAPYLDAAAHTGRKIVYDSHNVETVLRREIVSVGSLSLARRLRREMITAQVKHLERRLVIESDQIWVCSAEDRTVLQKLFDAGADIRVVPNGVNTTTFAPEIGARTPVPSHLDGDKPTVIFLGDLAYTPNEDGALYLLNEVLPAIDDEVDLRTVFVGRRPTDRLVAAAGDRPDTVVTGEVDEVLPYLFHGDLLAVTLRVGGGTRLKILEAMAAGLPIVTTSKGLEGIDANHGEHVLIADDPASLAAAITELLHNPSVGRELARKARILVDGAYSWEAIGRLIADATADLMPSAT